jgi:hypothetical protein
VKRPVKLALFLVAWFAIVAFAYYYTHSGGLPFPSPSPQPSPTPSPTSSPDTVTATVLPVEHGSYSPSVGVYTVDKGSYFSVRCYADVGYTLVGYEVNGVFQASTPDASINVVMDSDKTVKGVIT